jgi:hypothetical protein
MNAEGKLVPILRDGVDVIKMVFFKSLKTHLAEKYTQKKAEWVVQLGAAVLNTLFCTQNDAEPYASFAKENKDLIASELAGVKSAFRDLRIPLTDALRVQFLCDDLEGISQPAMLTNAEALGILIVEREVPFPRTFLNLARCLGSADGVLSPEAEKLNQLEPEPKPQTDP